MRVVLAPDSFAGTLSARQAAAALAAGWRRVAPGDALVEVPLSDGGPGFLDVLAGVLAGTVVSLTVADPLGRPVPGAVLVVPASDGAAAGPTAYVESAQAAGLHLLAPAERDPELTSSRGVGELVRGALTAGARRVVVGLGGSATNDGGAGMLAALGARWDGPWQDPRRLDLAGLDARLATVGLVAASDVDSPLLGLAGASAVFGPQKGASRAAVQRLDLALSRWSAAVEAAPLPAVLPAWAARGVAGQPGAGAAGGLGFALLALGAVREPGVDLVLTAVRLASALEGADLVVTGEGSYDATSLRGKVVSGVAAAALSAGIPCLVVAGQVSVGRREAAAHGVDAAYSAADAAGSGEAAVAEPARWLATAAAGAARAWSRRP